jgi:hypothetical protein
MFPFFAFLLFSAFRCFLWSLLLGHSVPVILSNGKRRLSLVSFVFMELHLVSLSYLWFQVFNRTHCIVVLGVHCVRIHRCLPYIVSDGKRVHPFVLFFVKLNPVALLIAFHDLFIYVASGALGVNHIKRWEASSIIGFHCFLHGIALGASLVTQGKRNSA